MIERAPNILIIDDEEGLRDMISFALGKEGYRVYTAKNGKEGVEKCEAHEMDVVVTDIKMPEMDGMSVLGIVKEKHPEIEVIVATGFGTMDTAIESLRKGAFDYIAKPFNIDELINLVGKALETKQLRSQLVSMKELDRLKDELLSMITHELRTPLTAVAGSVKILMNNLILDEEKKTELLDIMNRNVQKIRKLIDAILDYSKMEAGFWKLKKTDASPIGIISNAVKQIMDIAETEKMEIICNQDISGKYYPPKDVILNCDQEQLERVIVNLISNSIKYTAEKGKIAVWYEHIGGEIKFTVQDNGKGITAENLAKVFDKFYRIDNMTQRKETGLGLGLAICRKIVDLHGGKIWAESEGENMGTRFMFSVPVN
jgi:two-component system sensor histidine kinase/response regulator